MLKFCVDFVQESFIRVIFFDIIVDKIYYIVDIF